MNRQKTEVKVVVTSTEVKDGGGVRQDSRTGVKHSVRTVSSTNRVSESESTRITRTPNSTVSVTSSVRTPASCASRLTSSQSATPRTPSSRATDTETHNSHHATPATSSRTATPKNIHTPLPSTNSRTPATNTPRHPPGFPLPKRLKKGDESQKSESVQASGGGGLQRSRSIRGLDSEKREEDKKRRDRLGVRRVLSSSTFNVPSPARVSGGRLSFEGKSPSCSRSSLGRTAKVSLGSSTPTVEGSRRSSTKLNRSSSRPSADHLQPSVGLSNSLTPDVIRTNNDLSVSPSNEECFGKAESTAVFVGVRVRPLNSREISASESIIVDVHGNTLKVGSESGVNGHTFNFDHCFWSCNERHPLYASQESVYTTVAQPLLEKSYEGYNACLFAYGQTGSGKSYTMLGDGTLDEPDMEVPFSVGVIPRFCRELFDRARYIHSQNPPEHQLPQCLVEIEISYFEIYNERIYDLLSSGGGLGGVSGDHREALRVREHPETGPYVEGVARHLVSSYSDLQTWLLLGNKERSIAATGMNDKSSRSHAVFTIKLTQTMIEDVEGEQLESSKVSIINLVDLAGSERVAALQSQGDRLKEGVCINKSLLTLGKVITALAESAGRRRTFIPYRESVLTYLLKESLGGNSRTAMIATISPCKNHMEESLSTLRYAQQARKIVNHNYVNEDPTAMIIRSLKEEVERLRKQQLVRSPSMFFDAESMDVDENKESEEGGDDEREKALQERENAIQEKEREKNQAIKEKEAEIALLREQLRSQQLLSERNRNLEQRLKENEVKQRQALENQRLQGISDKGDKGPQLVNLYEDPHLSETLSYCLKDGRTTLGHSGCDLVLQGLHCEDVHCTVVNASGHLTLHPRIDTDTFVNGKLITSPVQLNHGDRVVLAGIYYFRVNIPNSDKNLGTKSKSGMDFYASQQELLREQERRLREEADAALAASKAELEMEMCQQRDILMQDIYEASSKLRNKEQLVSELEGKQWKLEEEKRLLEEQLLRNRKTSPLLDLSPPSPAHPVSNILQEIEAVFDESVMEVRRDCPFYAPPKIAFMIKEANQISKKLKKPYEFMVQELLTETGVELVVLLKDLHHQMTAKLAVNVFIEKVHVLRDILHGEQNEEDLFESGLKWERTEDVSCVPGFINKLRDRLNSSFNCSFSAPPSAVSRSNAKRRRSSLIFTLDKTSSTSSCGTIAGSNSSIAVATAIHNTLLHLPSSSATSHPLLTTLEAIAEMHKSTQIIKNHTNDPGSTIPDEELSKQLVMLLCASQVAIHSLSSSGHIELETSCNRCLQLQEKFQRAPVKITTGISRIFQGVKNEVESLVDEEGSNLITLSQSLVFDIGKLAIMAALPIPDTSKLKPGGPLFVNFTEGLRSGLESLLLKSTETALCSAGILTATESSEDSSKVLEAANTAMTRIASFLKRFARLNAAVEFGEGIPEDEQREITAEWIVKVESAADTIMRLDTSLADIGEHVEMPQALNSEVWKRLATELKRKLEKLMCFAGLGGLSVDNGENCSFSSNNDLEDSALFMEELQMDAKMSLQSVESLLGILNKENSSQFNELVSCDLGKKLLGQWPRNCDEYKKYLKHKTQQYQSPMKSSLRSSGGPREEKKVRFDITLDSSVSLLEDPDVLDTVNV